VAFSRGSELHSQGEVFTARHGRHSRCLTVQTTCRHAAPTEAKGTISMTAATCSVFNCTRPGHLSWSTGETAAEYADWPICRTHHAVLRSGADWATYNDLPNSARRWILVGDALKARSANALRDALISVEYTASGKELEIEVTTGDDSFVVILDRKQALDLVMAVAAVTDGVATATWDGSMGPVQ
jgi:hypothetical protein